MTREEILVLPASAELDTLVAEKVLGWRYEPWQGGYEDMHWTPPEGTDDEWLEPAPYSTDIAAAWQVVEKLRGRWTLALEDSAYPPDAAEPWTANFFEKKWPYGDLANREVQAVGDTAPLAICRAALLVVDA